MRIALLLLLSINFGFAADLGKPPEPGTLAFHLSTNLAARAKGRTASYTDKCELENWRYAIFNSTNLHNLTNATWSTNFWLAGVKGLSATSIGCKDGMGGQGLITMVSPRHYLFATHMHPEGFTVAFLATNNQIFWRRTLERVDIAIDTSVGILDSDLPPSVGFLPILAPDFLDYIPILSTNFLQGLGMNQDMFVFSQPIQLSAQPIFLWSHMAAAPLGPGTNWNIAIRGGDSSNPEMLLIENQLVLVSHNYAANAGPNYPSQITAINRQMHNLSTHNHLTTDYQLTTYSLTNWPKVGL